MGIFSSIMNKVFHHGAAPSDPAPSQSATPQSATPQSTPGTTAAAAPTGSPASAPAPSTPSAPVDVEAVLTDMASKKGGGGNWQTSIVDLLKLLDLDSSLAARKELGEELGVHAGADGTAEQNTALHRAVMQKMAENGGKVPDSMKA